MPRKPKNAPPPWWWAPLAEWVREVRLALTSNGFLAEAEAWRLLVRTRAEESARLKGLARAGDTLLDAAAITAAASHARGDELHKLVRGFMRCDAPAATSIADSWRAPPNPVPPDCVELLRLLLQVEQRRRAIIDDLPEDKRRQICAVAGVLWVAFHAHQHPTRLVRGGPRDFGHPGDAVGIARMLLRAESEAHALAIAGKVLGAMEAFYDKPRFVLTGSVVQFFAGETVSVDRQRELWDRRNRR